MLPKNNSPDEGQTPVTDDDEFILMFEAGEGIEPYLDLDNIRWPGTETRTMVFYL